MGGVISEIISVCSYTYQGRISLHHTSITVAFVCWSAFRSTYINQLAAVNGYARMLQMSPP